MTTVRGRTRTSRSNGSGSWPVVAAIPSRSARSVVFDMRARVAADRASGWRYGAAASRSSGASTRAAEAVAASGPTTAANEHSSSARSIALARESARRRRGAEIDDDDRGGLFPADEEVPRPGGAVGQAGVMHRRQPSPGAVEELVASPVDARLERGQVGEDVVQRPTVDLVADERGGPVGEPDDGPDLGARHARPPAQHQEQRLVLDLIERPRRPPSAAVAQDERAVGPVQEVGVAAVLAVDLEEQRAAARRRPHEHGAAAGGAHDLEVADRKSGRVEGRRDRGRGRTPVRRADRDEHRRARHPAGGDGEEGLGPPDRAGRHRRRRERHAREVRRVSPAPRQPGLRDREHGERTGDVRGRREPRREEPPVGVQTTLDGRWVDEHGRHQCGQPRPDGGRDRDGGEPAPSPLDDEHDHQRRRPGDGGELRRAQQELARRCRELPREVPEIVPHAVAGAGGDGHEEQGRDERDGPDEEADEVAGMAVVALPRRRFGRRRRRPRGHEQLARRRHVVPSRATAATTRSTSTMPASRPP